jgi:glucose-6-phosphate 1-dehydrogenase
VPSLYRLAVKGRLPEETRVVGVARSPWSADHFRGHLLAGTKEAAGSAWDEAAWRRFAGNVFYAPGDAAAPGGLAKLREWFSADEREPGDRLYYLSVAPELVPAIVARLSEAGMAEEGRGFRRLILEKPFGRDLGTARELNRTLHEHFDESQLYRIDHYLGKETVQNILAFRLANGIFEPIWNHNYIDHVQITVAESIGVDRRGGYYEQTGAFRDMVENHMLQLLSIVAMEPPVVFEAEPVRDEKLKVLKALRPIPPEQTGEFTLRGQYTAGKISGKPVASYRGEEKVAPDSWTETFVVMRLQIDNWRWAGTPFYLRHGKRLPTRATEIAIQFKRAPQMFFPGEELLEPNVLAMRIQPDEGISLRFGAKVPGPTMQLQEVDMNFLYGSSFGPVTQSDAYERLLLDAMLGDRTLFTRADEVEQAWAWAEDIQEGWSERPNNVHFYPAGTWGPAWADAFIERDGRQWRRL